MPGLLVGGIQKVATPSGASGSAMPVATIGSLKQRLRTVCVQSPAGNPAEPVRQSRSVAHWKLPLQSPLLVHVLPPTVHVHGGTAVEQSAFPVHDEGVQSALVVHGEKLSSHFDDGSQPMNPSPSARTIPSQ